jgi:hypothetical protein
MSSDGIEIVHLQFPAPAAAQVGAGQVLENILNDRYDY